jgi:hypothetical protein
MIQRSEASDDDWLGHGNESTNLSACLADGSCHSDIVNTTTSSQPSLENATSEIVAASDVPGETIALSHFKEELQNLITQAERDAGYLPGVTEEMNLTDDNSSDEPAIESGVPITDDGSDVLSQQGTPSSLLQSCEALHEGKLNSSRVTLSSTVKYRLRTISKDYVRTQMKKAAKNYAKSSLMQWINAQDGPCLSALDDMIGVVQEVYGCFKANYAQFTNAVCKPPDLFDELYGAVSSLLTNAKALNTLSAPLQYIPYVQMVAKPLYQVTEQVQAQLGPRKTQLDNYKQQPYHGVKGDTKFCKPFPKSGAKVSSTYNCPGCSSGSVCKMQTACNTVRGLEQKIDDWKTQNFDPIVEKFAEAVQYVQAASNSLNRASWLVSCNGFNTCSDLKTFTDKVRSSIESGFLNGRCPLPVPGVKFPNLIPLKRVVAWFAQISGVFTKIKVELAKPECVHIPYTHAWWEHRCWRVCFRCCSYRGRRRWAGSVRCQSCCSNTCTWVWRTTVTMKRYCFSALRILQGISATFDKVLGPIKVHIEIAINAIIAPIQGLFTQILRELDIDFGIPDLNLPSFDFGLPSLPALSCGALERFKR